MDSQKLIIDVGANRGDFCLEVARRNQGHKVIAFEPDRHSFDTLCQKVQELGISNLECIRTAISMRDGEDVLNISHGGDRGTTSLLKFDDSKIQTDKYWKTRTDLKHNDSQTVSTTRLDTFLKDLNFTEISFIKIDVQGLDIDVLRSSGDFLAKIKGGMLEVPTVMSKALYKDENYDLQKALNYMTKAGLSIERIKPNDPACNEVNVYFSAKGTSLGDIESQLGLTGVSIYDGKDFWHMPRAKLTDPELEILDSRLRIRLAEQEVSEIRKEILTIREAYNNLCLHPRVRDILS